MARQGTGSRTDARRRGLYELGADAVERVFVDAPRCYVCPLCLRGFLPRALDYGLLTLEHIPPRRMGGKPAALTCRECNNTAGHGLDNHLVAYNDNLDFAMGQMERALPGRYHHDGGPELNVSVLKGTAGIQVSVEPARNHPGKQAQAQAEWARFVASGTGGVGIHVTLDRPYAARRAFVAALRVAYLAGFAFLGYRYVLTTRMKPIREQLARPDDQVIPMFSTTDPKAERRASPDLLIVQEPPELRSLVVRFGRHNVFLPSPFDVHDIHAYLEMHSQQHDQLTLSVSGKIAPWPATLQLLADVGDWAAAE